MRDKLVRGLSCDEKLMDKLYEEEDLTLEKALQMCSTHEIRTKMSELSVQSKEFGVNALSQRGQRCGPWRGQSAHPQQRGYDVNKRGRGRPGMRGRSFSGAHHVRQQQQRGPGPQKPCSNCGYETHYGPECPAVDRICKICNKRGHFMSRCKMATKNVHDVEAVSDDRYPEEYEYDYSEDEDEHLYIETVQNSSGNEKQKDWRVDVVVEGTNMKFKIDSGSEVNTLPKELFDKIGDKMSIKPSKARLVGYFGQKQVPYGKVVMTVEHKDRLYPVEFLIVEAKNPILGLNTSVEMGLIKRIYEVVQQNSGRQDQNSK